MFCKKNNSREIKIFKRKNMTSFKKLYVKILKIMNQETENFKYYLLEKAKNSKYKYII